MLPRFSTLAAGITVFIIPCLHLTANGLPQAQIIGFDEDLLNPDTTKYGTLDDPGQCANRGSYHRIFKFPSATNYLEVEGQVNQERIVDFVTISKFKPGQSVLDLGTGPGQVAIAAAQAVGRRGFVVGIDYVPGMIDGARKIASQQKPYIPSRVLKFVVHDIQDLEKLPFIRGRKFDIITCASSLKYITNEVAVLKSWATFLKPGGRILFDVQVHKGWDAAYATQIAAKKLGLPVIDNGVELQTKAEIVSMVHQAGLEVHVTRSRPYHRAALEKQQVEFNIASDLRTSFYRCYLKTTPLIAETGRIYKELYKKGQDAQGRLPGELFFWNVVAKNRDDEL